MYRSSESNMVRNMEDGDQVALVNPAVIQHETATSSHQPPPLAHAVGHRSSGS